MLRDLPTRFFALTFGRVMSAVAALTMSAASIPAAPPAMAAHDTESEMGALPGTRVDTTLQLVILEAPGCSYCNLFRRYVLPAYSASPRAREVPLRFVDLNDEAFAQLGLSDPVDLVPTAVLLHNNREVGRIPGYLGPENFFHAINHLLAKVE